MSTNYYAFGPFPGGEQDGEGLHIGQTAAGWRFQFRSWPDRGITTYKAWVDFLQQPGVTIRNEYGRDVSVDEMDATMTETQDQGGWMLKARQTRYDGYHLDGPHAFCAHEFF